MTETVLAEQNAEQLSTAPKPVTRGSRSLLAMWRQLTSMRTALLLLALLALAAIPGSLLPQRGLNPVKVQDFYTNHPTLAPILDRLSLFDVFAAPWFAAIYLLLFVSLGGCLVPRIRLHARALRKPPPNAPRNLARLAVSDQWETTSDVVDRAARVLRSHRWRVRIRHEDGDAVSVAAEKGYLRETGNLVFHVALVVLLAGIALGGLFGYKGTVLVVDSEGFSNVRSSYDVFQPARLASDASLPPFSFILNHFDASYQSTGVPRSFDAHVTYQSSPDAAAKAYDIKTNAPLAVDGTDVYLVGHGYALRLQVRNKQGQIVYDHATPFLPDDAMFTSHGVVKVPQGLPSQMGFTGFFYPTFSGSPLGAQSVFPGPTNPVLDLAAWRGDLGLDSGRPQSVYSLPVAQLKSAGDRQLSPGQTWRLADGTSVTFVGVEQWATFQIAHDPGSTVVLVAAVLIVAGVLCSLRVRRRRMWVRAVPAAGGDGRTVVTAGGLARSDADGFAREFEALLRRMKD